MNTIPWGSLIPLGVVLTSADPAYAATYTTDQQRYAGAQRKTDYAWLSALAVSVFPRLAIYGGLLHT